MGPETFEKALERRAELFQHLTGTTCVRLLHGIAEGWPGVTIDRYGDGMLVQTWREPLEEGMLAKLSAVQPHLIPVWNHRKGGGSHGPMPISTTGTENGIRFDVTLRHKGQDPLLFLDFRVARRWVKTCGAKSVLNLYAYTCGIGVAAAVGGATRVLNVDFAESALAIGKKNASLNGVEMETLTQDVFPVVRQLAGLPVGGRRGKVPRYTRVPEEKFDLVVLDPPRWARSAWGAVDVVRDYPSLFKPALLATSEAGRILATNHVPTVALDDWLAVLKRTAEKAGRPLKAIEVLKPEADFPSFDGQHPLKIAVCEV